MAFSIDVCGSHIKASLLRPSEQDLFSMDRIEEKKRGFCLYDNGEWSFECADVYSKSFEELNCVYDYGEIIDLLVLTEKERELKYKEWSFKCKVKGQNMIMLELLENGNCVEKELSIVLGGFMEWLYSTLSCCVKGYSLNAFFIVPHCYTIPQRNILKNAANTIDTWVIRAIDENLSLLLPFLYYGNINRRDSTVILVDFGQLRVSFFVARVLKGTVTYLTNETIRSVSGNVITRMLLKYVSIKYKAKTGSSLFEDISDMRSLKMECEMAKITLSSSELYEIPFMKCGGKENIIIKRKELEALLYLPLFTLKKHIQKALLKINVTQEAIDYVILTGGNSKIPAIHRFFRSFFPHANHDCGSVVSYQSSIGASLLKNNEIKNPVMSDWVYRVVVDDSHFSIIGNSLQCLTHDVIVSPIVFQKSGMGIVRIVVERCLEKNLTKALNMPYEQAKEERVWEYVFGYHYSTGLKSSRLYEEGNNNITGLENEFTPYKNVRLPQLQEECVCVDSQIFEDSRMILTIERVHNGKRVYGSQLRFTCLNGSVVEHIPTVAESLPINHLFSSRLSSSLPPLTTSSSVTSSSIIPSLLADRSKSVILAIHPPDVPDNTIYVTCPNHNLRTQNLPQLINAHSGLSNTPYYKERFDKTECSDYSHYFTTKSLPRFNEEPFARTSNKLLFFTGPSTENSPVSACCYDGEFVDGKRHGSGREFSVSHETVYQGQWKENLYDGDGTMWKEDGGRYEGVFVDGVITGEGSYYHPDGKLVYHGMFKNGLREGKGQEFEEDGRVYEGEFKNDLRDGEGRIKYNGTVIFEGEWKKNLRHGYGLEFINQSIYEGDYWKGYKHGQGVLKRFDGQNIYEGEWRFDKKHGQGILYSKGNVYKGGFVNDLCEGEGVQYYDNVVIYEGGFVAGERHGYGILYRNKKPWMEGEFEEGKLHGECKIYDEEGRLSYEGIAVDNAPNGDGTQYLSTGEILEGEFLNGKLHGHGRIYDKNRTLLYEGNWYYGKRHGYGEYQDDRGLYQGEFENGEKCGKGKYTLFNGEVYEGEFVNGYYNGFGSYTTTEGRVIYEGEWRNGQRCGNGKCFFPNGEYYQGSFMGNMMCGKGIWYYKSGRPKFIGEFRNDMKNGEGVEYDQNGDIIEHGFYINDEQLI